MNAGGAITPRVLGWGEVGPPQRGAGGHNVVGAEGTPCSGCKGCVRWLQGDARVQGRGEALASKGLCAVGRWREMDPSLRAGEQQV